MGLALSSTAIVMQMLTEHRRLGTATGRTGFAILLLQDLAVLPILFLVGAFAARTDGPVVLAFAWAMGQALLAVAAILVLGRFVIRPLFRFIGSAANRDMFLALVLLVIIGTALATHEIGLSLALGAFLAGLLLAESEYRHEIALDIEPFKGLLLGLFFVSVGMSVDVAAVAERPLWLIASVVGLFAVKGLIIYILVRLFGGARPVALEVALLLGQAGEFGLLVIGMSTSLELMPRDTAQFMLIAIALTMIATPSIAAAARRLARRIQAGEVRADQPEGDLPTDLSGHVIVAGYGRVGQMVGSFLDAHEVPYLALDTDAELVSGFHDAGAGVFLGDASRAEMLQKFGVERAAALVMTTDSPEAAEHIVETARRLAPDMPIYARARDNDHAARLTACGATRVVPELTEASLQLSEIVLRGAGIPANAAHQIVEATRDAEQGIVDGHRRRK
jgi:CPA2 family monovalent cation:H+ antiporter-2